jgi:hypothetical protein
MRSAIAAHNSELSALRLSARFSVSRRMRSSRLASKLVLIDVDLHAKQRGAKRFPLRVYTKREFASS